MIGVMLMHWGAGSKFVESEFRRELLLPNRRSSIWRQPTMGIDELGATSELERTCAGLQRRNNIPGRADKGQGDHAAMVGGAGVGQDELQLLAVGCV